MSTQNKPNEIYINRIYDAPVKIVWDAWTDPKQAAKWWGPRGFTITTHSKDLKVGGHWKYTMHGPDGTNYENNTLYHEVEPYSRLVYDHGGNEERPPLFRVTVQFTEIKGKTKMEMTMTLPTAEAAVETKKFIKKASGDSTWDRLAEYLEKEKSGKEQFVINRTFDAPLETLFEMWTNPKHFSQWLPPTGATMEFIHSDVKPGGKTFYSMKFAGMDTKMYGIINYLEIKKPDHLLYTQQFTDEKENASRHPFAPTWPETMLTTVTLSVESSNKTRVTVQWEPQGHVPRIDLETFINGRAGMTQGWSGSFDKLEAHLASHR